MKLISIENRDTIITNLYGMKPIKLELKAIFPKIKKEIYHNYHNFGKVKILATCQPHLAKLNLALAKFYPDLLPRSHL